MIPEAPFARLTNEPPRNPVLALEQLPKLRVSARCKSSAKALARARGRARGKGKGNFNACFPHCNSLRYLPAPKHATCRAFYSFLQNPKTLPHSRILLYSLNIPPQAVLPLGMMRPHGLSAARRLRKPPANASPTSRPRPSLQLLQPRTFATTTTNLTTWGFIGLGKMGERLLFFFACAAYPLLPIP